MKVFHGVFAIINLILGGMRLENNEIGWGIIIIIIGIFGAIEAYRLDKKEQL